LQGHGLHHIDLSENTAMQLILCSVACALMLATSPAHAQANVLGLPAVPQNPVQPAASAPGPAPAGNPATAASGAAKRKPAASASAAASAASAARAAPPPQQINDAEAKAVLSGGVTMASSYLGKVATVRVTTNNTYPGEALRRQALNAARLVQRDLALSCAWQCKPAPMPAPKVLADDKLQFEMVIDNYPRILSYDDMIAMLLGKPLAVAPKPAATATAAPPTPTAPTASPTAP
jgi:hypothetical protein